ncbi:hypothetical protein FRZ06_14845 [Anoxybacterium hadale]|uniref:Uncharacterized protein n=1 Tax=Anoxybacterium hadale TaxID=3408580 RepID=A0ACD1ADJ6_9FIRM|nr:hypothetical protein FRZ06_14845 [Clostridiales bacterium]
MNKNLSLGTFCLAILLILVVSYTQTICAFGLGYQSQSISTYTITFKATGEVTVSATSSEPLCKKIVSKITLQEAPKGALSFNDSSQSIRTKTANGRTIKHSTKFSLEKDMDYRVKVNLAEHIDGETVSRTYYKYL